MKCKSYFIIILVFIFFKTYGQKTEIKVNGHVFDTLFMPIEYATIQLSMKNDSTHSYGAITQYDGSYFIKNVEPGDYLIKYSAIGYKSMETSVNISENKQNQTVKPICLKEDIISIDEVTVKGTRKGFSEKVDKTIFVPDSITLRSAKTGLDVLRKLPEIRVDKNDRSLSIMGNKNILVLINGVDNNRSIESINPNDIEKIEIITHPSVKYRSDIASVINIVLKGYKEKGFTINNNLYYSINKKNHSGNLQLGYQIDKWRFFVSYFGNFTLSESYDSTLRYDKYDDESIKYKTTPIGNNEADFMSNNIQFGFDYDINKKNVFNFTSKLTGIGLESYRKKKVLTLINEIPSNSTDYKTNYSDKKSEQNYSLYFLHKFKKEDASIAFNTNFYFLNNTSEYVVNDSSVNLSDLELNKSLSTTKTQYKQNSINQVIDYTYPFSENIKLDAGYQFYLRNINNLMWATEDDKSKILYYDLRNSLYGNMSYTLSKMTLQIGGRVEIFSIDVNESANTQTKLLPYSSFLYSPNSQHSIKLTYRKILNYPNYSSLNPYRYYSSDSLTYSTGNPYLKPEQKNLFSLKYIYRKKNTYMSSGLSISFLNDFINQETLHQGRILVYNYANVGKANQYGVDVSFSTVLFDWLEFESQLKCYYTDFINRKEYNGFSYSIDYGLVLPLPLDFDLEIYGLLTEREIDFNGYSKYKGYIDEILISRQLIKNLFIGLAVWQPFFKISDTYKQWDATFSESNIYTEANSTSYLVNLTYSFKSGKKVNKTERVSLMESNSNNNKAIRK